MEELKVEMIERFNVLYAHRDMFNTMFFTNAKIGDVKSIEALTDLMIGNYALGFDKINRIYTNNKNMYRLRYGISSMVGVKDSDNGLINGLEELFIYISSEDGKDIDKAMKLDVINEYIRLARYVNGDKNNLNGYYDFVGNNKDFSYNTERYNRAKRSFTHAAHQVDMDLVELMHDVTFTKEDKEQVYNQIHGKNKTKVKRF